MSDQNGGKPITPEEYHKVLSGLELENIYLLSCSCRVDRETMGVDVVIKLNDEADYDKSAEGNEIRINHHFSLEAVSRKTRRKSLQLKCTYGLSYTSPVDVSDEFFDKFKVTSLPLNTWPFFRELVNNLTSRMYIPPLTLPLLKRPGAVSMGKPGTPAVRKSSPKP